MTKQHATWRRSAGLAVLASFLCATVASGQRSSRIPVQESPELSTMDLEQLMKVEVVVAASKRAQLTRDVPSFVSVVTADQIKKHGYRTLADVLNTLPSFYVANDRNFSTIGVRGFQRPGDYSSRVLVLLNGLRTNDNVYDQASIGEDFGVDVDLIARIEVIRGPSAALYGNNAIFAVINIVTKQGSSLRGGEVATSAASFGTYAGRASYGRAFANDGDVLVSASVSDSKGQRLYFPAFDNPATNNGIAEAADRESSRKLYASVSLGDFSFQASNSSREKGVPTAPYFSRFNDPRSETVGSMTLASLAYNRSFGVGGSVAARVHGGRWGFDAEYGFDSTDAVVLFGEGDVWGVDVDATRAIGRQFISVGAEFRDNFRQDRKYYDPDLSFLYTDSRNRSSYWGLFAQDEIKLFEPLTLHLGLRYDASDAGFRTTSPRFGLIYTPGPATTVKVLAGRAFRAPNDFELHLDAIGYLGSTQLVPERIETQELIAQRLIGGGVQLSAAAFRNRLSALIDQVPDSATGTFVLRNGGEFESRGIELGIVLNRGHGVTGGLTYALQKTEDRATDLELTNSPRHMAKLHLLAPFNRNISGGLDAQYISSRRTLRGNLSRGYTVTNVSLLAPMLFNRVDLSATIYNLLDVKYGAPSSPAFRQDIIQQNGRSFRVRATFHY